MSYYGETMKAINALLDKHVPSIMRAHGYRADEIPPPLRVKKPRAKHAPATDGDVVEWARLYYEAKLGCDAIGHRTGRPTQMIQEALKKRGYVLRTRKEAAVLRKNP